VLAAHMTRAALRFRTIRRARMAMDFLSATGNPRSFQISKRERHLMLNASHETSTRSHGRHRGNIVAHRKVTVTRPATVPIGGAHSNDGKTESPIKHVIVIIGENRTFDHIFATYEPREGRTCRQSALQGNHQGKTVRPVRTTLRPHNSRRRSTISTRSIRRQRPRTTPRAISCRRRELPMHRRSATPRSKQAALNGPGCLATLSEAARGD